MNPVLDFLRREPARDHQSHREQLGLDRFDHFFTLLFHRMGSPFSASQCVSVPRFAREMNHDVAILVFRSHRPPRRFLEGAENDWKHPVGDIRGVGNGGAAETTLTIPDLLVQLGKNRGQPPTMGLFRRLGTDDSNSLFCHAMTPWIGQQRLGFSARTSRTPRSLVVRTIRTKFIGSRLNVFSVSETMGASSLLIVSRRSRQNTASERQLI
jgi:hypothetical protein